MRLLADLGGTHARFAVQAAAGAPLCDVRTLTTAAHASLDAAIAHYLASGHHTGLQAMAIGVAAPVLGDQVQMVNCPWAFSQAALRRALALERLVVLNDFAALALGVAALGAADLLALGGAAQLPAASHAPNAPNAARIVIGPGTGLGAATLLPLAGGGWQVLAGELGHATLAPETPLEAEIAQWLVRHLGYAAQEFVLSGPGLVRLHQALAQVQGRVVAPRTAPQISAAADAGDAHCQQVRTLFLGMLGSAAGNLALANGATGGVYLAGGILPAWRHMLGASPLRQRFEAKGSYAAMLAPVPMWLVVAPQSPALAGAALALG